MVNYRSTIFLELVFGQQKMKQLSFLVFLFLSGVFSEPIWAHGSQIKYHQITKIVLQARFDDGTPMKNAQAVVYSPQDPTTPWLTGITDENGQFNFVPDPNLSGNWDVKIRQSGHGDIISIPLVAGRIASGLTEQPNLTRTQKPLDISETGVVSSNNELTPWQKLLMTITSVWGFIGTACYFSRNKHSNNS